MTSLNSYFPSAIHFVKFLICRYGWRESIWKWLPSVPGGSISVIDSKGDWEHAGDAKILIVSYDFIQKKKEELDHLKVVIFVSKNYRL